MIELSPAQPADLPAIDAIYRTTFCDTFGHLYSADDLATFLAGFTPAAWAGELADPAYAFRLAEVDDAAAGYIKLGPPKLPHVAPGPALELKQLYVRQAFHGSGVAMALMDWAMAEARARGAASLYLSVFTENIRAQKFYARYGFVDVGPYAFMVGNQPDEDRVWRLNL